MNGIGRNEAPAAGNVAMDDIAANGGPGLAVGTPDRRLRVAFVCNHSFAANTLYRGLFAWLRANGVDSEMIVGDDQYLDVERNFADVPIHVVPMLRQPAPRSDIVALLRFIRFFRRHRFDVIHVSTPKAALLGALGARLAGQPRVLFVVRTRIYQNRTGASRWFYERIDWLISQLSAAVAPVSPEIGSDMVAAGIAPAARMRYFGLGSSNGIDTVRFGREPAALAAGAAIRAAHGIPHDATVLLFLGRLAREKGVQFLPAVLDAVQDRDDVWMIIAGPADSRDPTDESVLAKLRAHPRVVILGYQADPVPLYAASNLFVFPSLREGFANVALEAQAMHLPVVGFDIPGVRGAVEHATTGLLVRSGDGAALAEATAQLTTDSARRRAMGAAGQARVAESFSSTRIWGDLRKVLVEIGGADNGAKAH